MSNNTFHHTSHIQQVQYHMKKLLSTKQQEFTISNNHICKISVQNDRDAKACKNTSAIMTSSHQQGRVMQH